MKSHEAKKPQDHQQNVPGYSKEAEVRRIEMEKKTRASRKATLETIQQMAGINDPAIQVASVQGVGLLAERGSTVGEEPPCHDKRILE
jgi:hypothetical protein